MKTVSTATQVLMMSTLLNVLESHHNKPFDILVLLERKICIEMHVSCLYLHKLSKNIFHGTHMFDVL